MDSPSAPAAPDPYVVAGAQAGANREAASQTASLNRADQYTPYGSLTWTQGDPTRTFNENRYNEAMKQLQTVNQIANMSYGGSGTGDSSDGGGGPVGTAPQLQMPDRNDDRFYDMTPSDRWTSKVTLDPRIQSLFDANLSTSQGLQSSIGDALGRVNSTMSKPIDYAALPAAPQADEAARKRVEDALYDRYTSRLNPQFSQQENQLRSNLMNRGIAEGSEAWKDQLDNFGRTKNDAYRTALDTSIATGGQEMSRYYDLQDRSRQNALTEEERKRALVMNELNALRSGAQVNTPQFANTPSGAQVNAAPIGQAMQNQYQGQLGAYGADVGAQNANTAAMGTTVAALLPLIFSDRRLKSNIVRLGTHPRGIGWYEYDIFGKRTQGVMADELEQVLPEAVHTLPSGFKVVNYGML